jgi:hypothetical protein
LAVTARAQDIDESVTPTTSWTEAIEVGANSTLMLHMQYQAFATAETATGDAAITMSSTVGYITQLIVFQEQQPLSQAQVFSRQGVITAPSGTGNQDTTGIGFDVKALYLWTSYQTGTSVESNMVFGQGVGADDGVTTAAQRYTGLWQTSGGSVDGGYGGTGEILKVYDSGNSTLGSPDLSAVYSRITDGFRLNWSATTENIKIHYLALGGDDLEAAVADYITSQDPYTGLPWEPEMVMMIGQGYTSATDYFRTIPESYLTFADTRRCIYFTTGMNFDFGNAVMTINPYPFAASASTGGVPGGVTVLLYTTSDGWKVTKSGAEYWFPLALRCGDSSFPWYISIVEVSNDGTDDVPIGVPDFGSREVDIQTVLTVTTLGTATANDQDNVISIGGSEFNGNSNENCISLGSEDAGTLSERVDRDDRIGEHDAAGDLTSPDTVLNTYGRREVMVGDNDTNYQWMAYFAVGRPRSKLRRIL